MLLFKTKVIPPALPVSQRRAQIRANTLGQFVTTVRLRAPTPVTPVQGTRNNEGKRDSGFGLNKRTNDNDIISWAAGRLWKAVGLGSLHPSRSLSLHRSAGSFDGAEVSEALFEDVLVEAPLVDLGEPLLEAHVVEGHPVSIRPAAPLRTAVVLQRGRVPVRDSAA